jgi:purine-binding chemotaxis protein CheW
MMARQFCTFFVGELFLGIEVTRIQEVLRDWMITPVPTANPAIRGLINLRGQIITAVDLRTRFQIPDRDRGDPPPTILVLDGSEELQSLVVDRSGDVLEIEDECFEEPPDTLKSESRRLIQGAFKLEHSLLLVLDIDHVFDLDAADERV